MSFSLQFFGLCVLCGSSVIGSVNVCGYHVILVDPFTTVKCLALCLVTVWALEPLLCGSAASVALPSVNAPPLPRSESASRASLSSGFSQEPPAVPADPSASLCPFPVCSDTSVLCPQVPV